MEENHNKSKPEKEEPTEKPEEKKEEPKQEEKKEVDEEDKALRKIDEFSEDMKNYPQLEVREGMKETPFIEKLKAYYQIKQMEFNKKHLDFIKLERTLFIVLTAFNIILFSFNVWLSNENNRIMREEYLIPKEATLKHIWMQTQGSFSRQDLSRGGDQLTQIRICFYNEGRAPTGYVRADIKIGHPYFNSGGLGIDNILGGQIKCSNMFLVNNNVTFDEEDKPIFNEEHLPLGNYTLKLYTECEFCISEPFKIKEIPICIWGGDYSSTNCDWTVRKKW